MKYTLENEELIAIFISDGAQLCSLYSKISHLEYIHDGNPASWKYHSPTLFPIVGRVNNNEYKINDITYTLPQHGLARLYDYDMIHLDNTSIKFKLSYNLKTLQNYPYKFNLIISYYLNGSTLEVNYLVENSDEKVIYFQLGAHPAFNIIHKEKSELEDYYFKFNKFETTTIKILSKDGSLTKQYQPFLENENIISITKSTFDNNALIFSDLISDSVSIINEKINYKIEMNFKDFPTLALWSLQKNSPFICLEPWFGHADYEDFNGQFKDKEGIQELFPHESFSAKYTLTIN